MQYRYGAIRPHITLIKCSGCKTAARILTGNFDYVNTRGIDLVKTLGLMNVSQRRDYLMTSKIPVRWPGQCYGFTLSLIFKYCGGI